MEATLQREIDLHDNIEDVFLSPQVHDIIKEGLNDSEIFLPEFVIAAIKKRAT